MNDKKKTDRQHDFLISLGGVDEKLASQAFAADTKEKFGRLERKRRRNISAVISAAASFILVCGVIAFLPMIAGKTESEKSNGELEEIKKHEDASDEGVPPFLTEGRLVIESADMWNYYAEIKSVYFANSPQASSNKTATLGNGVGYDRYPDGSECPNPPPEVSESTPPTASSEQPPNTFAPENVFYYDLSDFGELNITRATYLQAELTERSGFLASVIGLGRIEIVITEIGGFDSMITFKNGDKYFSCLENGLNEFSSHKYIDGFYVVKNLNNEISRFSLTLSEDGEIADIKCSISNPKNHLPDEIRIIENTQKSADVKKGYSIKELEDYFNRLYSSQ